MSLAPVITQSQLESLLSHLFDRVSSTSPLIFVRGDPRHAPQTAAVPPRKVEVMASASPLAIRAAAIQERDDSALVIVTDCDGANLGADLLARSVRGRVHQIDRWTLVASLFGAEVVTQALAEHPVLGDALIEARPVSGFPQVASRTLDRETALAALTRQLVTMRSDTMVGFLQWAESPDAARTIRETDAELVKLLESHLVDALGPGVKMGFAVLRQQKGVDLMALALTADVVYPDSQSDTAPNPVAATRLDLELGDPDLSPVDYRDLADAAVNRAKSTPPTQDRSHWFRKAEELIDQMRATDEVWRSSVIPRGFDQRLAQAGRALTNLWNDPSNNTVGFEADKAIEAASCHLSAYDTPYRVERLRMVARLIRRSTTDFVAPDSFAAVVGSYVTDEAWFERAWLLVTQSDPEPAVADICKTVGAWAMTKHDHQAKAASKHLAKASQMTPPQPSDSMVGVEHIAEQILAPLAKDNPVLLLVLDGMGWPSFLDVLDTLQDQGWLVSEHPSFSALNTAIAALPTTTEVSRTSLLCGRIRAGNKDSESRGFSSHPALVAQSSVAKAPRVFHKSDLRRGGIDTLPTETLDVISDHTHKVVSVVLNSIDERLKDVAPPPGGWSLDELTPIREVLDSARRAGRVVVLTADHGHVVERGGETRAKPAGGGERWQPAGVSPLEEGEIEVQGPRVVVDGQPDQAIVMPWSQQLRYKGGRNGYHGGLTASELIVPVVVMAADTSNGLEPSAIVPPQWWYPQLPAQLEPVEPKPAKATKAKKPVASRSAAPTLFDMVEPDVESSVDDSARADRSVGSVTDEQGQTSSHSTGDPISVIMNHDHVTSQLVSLRLSADQVEAIIRLLDAARGTPMSETRVADQAGINRVRMSRLVAQLQRLLNIDGYAVLEAGDGGLRFDRALLETQLGLT